MNLTCQNCEHAWDYGGDADYYATCPNCHYKVPVDREASA